MARSISSLRRAAELISSGVRQRPLPTQQKRQSSPHENHLCASLSGKPLRPPLSSVAGSSQSPYPKRITRHKPLKQKKLLRTQHGATTSAVPTPNNIRH